MPLPAATSDATLAAFAAFERGRAEAERLADDLAQAVTGDFDFTVRFETNDYVFQKLCIMINFLLETVRRSLADVKDREEDLRRANGELERTNRELLEANRCLVETRARAIESAKMAAVGTLVAGLCHEINNPLGVILGFAESARLRLDSGHMLALPLRSIEREAIRCKGIVDDLLTFSRRSPLDLSEAVDLGSIARAIAAMVRAQAAMAEVELDVEATTPPPVVHGSRRQLEQVVLNLVRNALDAMPHGGKLKIRAACDEDQGVMAVEDTGSGIPEEIVGRMFEPFFTTKDVGRGTGLGLAISREIVERHGGRIELASRFGEGSRFMVRIPLARDPAERSA